MRNLKEMIKSDIKAIKEVKETHLNLTNNNWDMTLLDKLGRYQYTFWYSYGFVHYFILKPLYFILRPLTRRNINILPYCVIRVHKEIKRNYNG